MSSDRRQWYRRQIDKNKVQVDLIGFADLSQTSLNQIGFI